MFNHFKPAQKDSSCLNISPVSSPLEYNNSYGGMKNSMGDMNMNKNCSSNTDNNNNMCAASSNDGNNNGGDNKLKWLQEALTNPQLAGSANVFLQTTNYINNCSASNDNQTNNVNVMNSSVMYSGPGGGSYNVTSNTQANMSAQLSGQRPQVNDMSNIFTNTNSSYSRQATPNNSFQGGQNHQNSYRRQEAGTPRSLSSEASMHTAGAANLYGNALNFATSITPVQYGNTGSFQQQQQQQSSSWSNNNSIDMQTLQLLQQKMQRQNVNQSANCLQQQTQNQNLSIGQQHQGANQATNQQLMIMQEQQQQQHVQGPTNKFNSDFFANLNQLNSGDLGGQSQIFASTFDDLNNLEPADFRQETSEDLDLSFLLDDTSPVDFNGGDSNSNNANRGMGMGSSGLANLNPTRACTAPAPVNNMANNQPQLTTSAASLPGSSQQMQEHLREITQQHMQQFQMAQVGRQLKQTQRQLSKQKKALQAKLGTNDFKTANSNGPNSPTPRNNEKKPRRQNSMGKPTTQAHNRNLSVSSDTQQPINFDTMVSNQRMSTNQDNNYSANYNGPNSSQPIAQAIMFSNNNISCVEMTRRSISEGASNINRIFSNSMENMNGNRHQYLPVVGGGMKRKREASTGEPCSRMPEMKSLYEYFESMLSSRGYSLMKLPAKEIGYMSQPSPLQSASFGFAICSSIKAGGAGRLAALLSSGLSPNPTNKFGDSPFFLACKRGLHELVKTFVDHGADVRVADGFGRTPLHHVAWSNDPCFTSAKILLEADARLICVTDNFGKTPLDFVGDSNRLKWLDFLESVKDSCWPQIQKGTSYAPESKNGSAMPDPSNALSVELAEQVASGHVLPEEILKNCEEF